MAAKRKSKKPVSSYHRKSGGKMPEPVRRPSGRPHGRPPEPVPEQYEDEIIEWLDSGKLLSKYCAQPGKPTLRSIYLWRDKDERFASRLSHARETGYDVIAEDTFGIADSDVEEEHRWWLDDPVRVARDKLRIDTRARMLGRWSNRYSDKQRIEHSGKARITVVTGVPDPETPDDDDMLS